IGDAIAKQPADAIRALKERDVVPGLVELRCGGKARRARPDDGNPPPRPTGRHARLHPTLRKRALDDLLLDVLNGHRVLVDGQYTRRFTGRRTQTASELREVV